MIKINLYGAPSSGKSTLAGQLFGELKSRGLSVAFVQEYAKEQVYQGVDMTTLEEAERIIILGEQFRREKILENKVKYLVTDSPLLLTAYYHKDPKGKFDFGYAKDIAMRHLKSNELHIWLQVEGKFEEEERSHNKEQSLIIQKELKEYLISCGIHLIEVKGKPQERLKKVLSYIEDKESNYETIM